MTRRAVMLVLTILAAAAPALAQVDAGREALANAEFGRAIRAFDAAERGPLEREDYLSLLEGRALASWANGNAERARADLRALAAIEPTHVFPREAPPDLTESFAEMVAAREGPIGASALFTPAGDALTVTVQNDDLGLVSLVRAHVRADAWVVVEREEPRTATFPIPPDARHAEAWVELVGRGGAVLATVGSEARPIVWERVPEDVTGELSDSGEDARGSGELQESTVSTGGGDDALWIGLGVGGGALVVVAVVIAIALAVSSQGPAGTQPGAPVVVGF